MLSKSFFKSRFAARNPSSSTRGPKVKNFNPVHWSEYFYAKDLVPFDMRNDDDVFTVYRASGSLIKSPQAVVENKLPVAIFLHGAGFSALTWAPTVKLLTEMIDIEVIAIDMRGHGETKTSDDGDLSTDRLISDVIQVAHRMHLENNPIILIGHSLGGSLVVQTALRAGLDRSLHIVGIVVIDVVESTAMESLGTMQSVLSNRKERFEDLKTAIKWSIESGKGENLQAARVSIPGQMKHIDTNEPATYRVYAQSIEPEKEEVNGSGAACIESVVYGTISEEILDNYVPKPCPFQYTWRVNLKETEKFWFGWFSDLTEKFLEVRCPKLLLLAGMDRLDREMTVAHMQGKFQMEIVNNVGHNIQEDDPYETALKIANFIVHQKVAPPWVKKDGALTFPGC